MTYKEKLLDPRWQKKRLEILERDKWRCCDCGDGSKTLHVHHLIYEKDVEPWEYPEYYLQTLCVDCHTKYEEMKHSEESELVKMYRMRFKDTFIRSCLQSIMRYEEISDAVYLMWDLGIKESVELLSNALREKAKPFFEKFNSEQGNCPACGNIELRYFEQYNSSKCTFCGYVKQHGENTINQA